MKSVAVFMGAGASKPFGFPLTKELLPLIKESVAKGELFANSSSDRELLLHGLKKLLPGFNSIDPTDLPLITDVLSLIDHSLHLSNVPFPQMVSRELVELRILLERALLKKLDISELTSNPPDILTRLIKWLTSLAESNPQPLGIISTNYDVAVESQLFGRYPLYPELVEKFDFGFSWRDVGTGTIHARPERPTYRLYKLHGSLNWLRCDLCEHIYINPYSEIASLGFLSQIGGFNTCHCQHAPLRSVIVAPSLVRDIRDVNLLELWRTTLELLRTTDKWVIIGYSFPPEDIAIRLLFLRAYNGRTKELKIKVVQGSNDPVIRARYKVFFPDCEFEVDGLEGFLSRATP
jgi:hypothetical protein